MNKTTLHFDGACEPTNPGGYGIYAFVVRSESNVHSHAASLGRTFGDAPMTNNVAEYTSLIKGLEHIAAHEKPESLAIYGDSKLVVEQVNGRWRINNENLRRAVLKVLAVLEQIGCKWTLEWIPREENAETDALCNEVYRGITGSDIPKRTRH